MEEIIIRRIGFGAYSFDIRFCNNTGVGGIKKTPHEAIAAAMDAFMAWELNRAERCGLLSKRKKR